MISIQLPTMSMAKKSPYRNRKKSFTYKVKFHSMIECSTVHTSVKMLYIYLTIIFILAIILYKVRWHRFATIIDTIPGPAVHFISVLGNVPSFNGSQEFVWDALSRLNKIYYPIYRLWMFEEAFVHILHPDDVEIFLTSPTHITKSSIYELFQPWLGTGLLTSTGFKWHHRRKILTSAFHFNILNEYVSIFDNQARQMVAYVKKSQDLTHNIGALFTKFTLNTICETSMGVQLDDERGSKEFRWAIHKLAEMIFIRGISTLSRFEWIFAMTPTGWVHSRALKILHNFTTTIINKRKSAGQSFASIPEDKKSDENEVGIKRKKKALLDLLIEEWKDGRIDDNGIREEVDTFMFEGHDTTAAGMTFAVFLLAVNTKIQERARIEVNEVMKRCNGNLGPNELKNLPYLEQCIKESLRLYPAVPIIGRITADDLQLKHYLVPKGTTIHIFLYHLHRDPKFWPNPNVFDPDRFSPERSQGRHPFAYVPFSAGPRNCIGQKFAMMELKATIAHLLHNFYLEPVTKINDLRFKLDFVILPSEPIQIKFHPIKN